MSNIIITSTEIQEYPMALSISDDDFCATCKHCAYVPGDLSLCKKELSGEATEFPGVKDEEDTVDTCDMHEPIKAQKENWAA